MSFSRARIRRFNDGIGDTPAPGSYNPKFDNKIVGTGAVIEKCERFAAPKSVGGQIPQPPAALDTSFDAGRKSSSLSNLPVFRTPKIPQKTKKAVSVKGKAKTASFENQTEEKLSQDLESLLNAKELKIRDLEVDLELLKEEYERNEEVQRSLFLEMEQKLDEFKIKIAERDATVESQQALISCNTSEIADLKLELLEKKNINDKLRQVTLLNKTLTVQNSEVLKVKNALDEKIDDLVNEIFKLRSAEKELCKQHSTIIEEMDQKMELLKTQACAEKLHYDDTIEGMQFQRNKLENDLADKELTICMLKNCNTEADENLEKLKYELSCVIHDSKEKELAASEMREEFEKKISQKQDMILLLQAELSEKEIEQEEFSSERSKMLEQTELYRKCLDDLEVKVMQLLSKIDDLNNNLTMMEENVMNASILKENMESTISCQQSAFEALQVDYDALRIDLEGRMVNQIMESSRKFSELRYELLETRGKLQYVENDCMSLNRTRLDLQGSLVRAMQDIESHVLARDELRVINLDYQLTIADLHNKVDSLSVELNANSTYWAQQVTESRTEANKLRHQCKMLEIGSANTLETLQAVSDRLVECNKNSEAQAQELATIQQYNSALEKELSQQAEALEAQKLSTILLEAESIREIEEVRTSLLEKLDHMGQCYENEKKKLMHEIGEDLAFSQMQISNMICKVEEESLKYAELKELHKNLQHTFKLKGEALEETKFDLLRLQDLIKEKEKQIYTLENEVAVLKHDSEQSSIQHMLEMEVMHKSLADNSFKVLAIEATNIQLGQELASKNSEAAEQKKHLEMELFSLENEIEKCKTENISLKSELASLTKSTENANGEAIARYENLLTELNAATTKNLEATKELEALNSLLSAEKVDREHDKVRFLATIKEKNDCLYSQAETEEKWSLLAAEISSKDAQVQDLKSALKLASERLQSISNEMLAKEKQLSELKEALQQSTEKVKCLESENWKSKYLEMASLVGPFREQLEEFEAERQKLESRKEAADNQVKDLSLKYAQVLGHQNHKQKIHHVVQLKEHNLELKKTIEKLEGDIRSRDKSLKKLKAELVNTTRLQKLPTNKARMPMTPLALSHTENTNPNYSPGRQSPSVKHV